jgi:hypothetical protein
MNSHRFHILLFTALMTALHLVFATVLKAQLHHTEIIFKGHHLPKTITCRDLLKTHAKEVHNENFIFKNDSLVYGGFSKWQFDSAGFATEHSWLIVPDNGEKNTFEYDDAHRLTLKTRYSARGEFWENHLCSYTLDGQLLEIKIFKSSGKLDHVTKFFYQNDTLISKEIYETAIVVGQDYAELTPISLDETINYSYKNGLLVKAESFDENGKLSMTISYNYDQMNRCIYKSYPSSEHYYELDENGNIVKEETSYQGKQNATPVIQQFEKKQLVYKKYHFLHDDFEERWEYDEQGYKIRHQKLKNGVLVEEQKVDFEYDAQNNWIKNTITVNGIPKSLCIRKIQY